MQPTIVIATHNHDKFKIVTSILSGLGLASYRYLSLDDLRIDIDLPETGQTVEERAREKAEGYSGLIAGSRIDVSVEAIVGVDDGLYLHQESRAVLELKALTDEILAGQRVQHGDRVDLLRGYAIRLLSSEVLFSCTTRIPFVFLGNAVPILRQDGEYPLSYVLGRLGTVTPVAEDDLKLNTNYYIQHSRSELQPIVQVLLGARARGEGSAEPGEEPGAESEDSAAWVRPSC